MEPAGLRTVVALVVVLLSDAEAFHWTSDIEDGGHLVACMGDNVTFPWAYVTEAGENVIAHFWFRNKTGSFASFTNHFTKLSARVTHAGKAEITLHNISREDADTYGVSIEMLGRRTRPTQRVSLMVTEPPKTTDGQLHVTEDSQSSVHTRYSSQQSTRLKCGHFLSLGFPNVSAVWMDPSGRRLHSTSFRNGYFYLELGPQNARVGNYTCSLQHEAEATQCLDSDSPLLAAATYRLATLETILSGLDSQVMVLHNVSTEHDTRLSALQVKVSEHSSQILDLQKHSTQQDSQISELQREDTSLNSLITDLQKQITNQTSQITDLQNHSTQQDSQISGLQRENTSLNSLISDIQKQSTDHNSQITDLQKQNADKNSQISELQRQNADLQKLTTHQTSQMSDLQKVNTDLKSQVSGLQKEARDQNSQISDLQTQNAMLQTQLSEQSTAISSLKTLVSQLQQAQDNQVADLEDNMLQLSGQQAKLSQLDTQLSGQQDKLSRLDTQLSSQQDKLSQLDTQLGSQQTQLSSHRTQISDLNSRVTSHLEDKARSLQSDVKQCQSDVSRLQKDLGTVKALTGKLDKKVAFHTVYKQENVTQKEPIHFQLVSQTGGGYDVSTGKFTAPYNGWYSFQVQLFPHNTADQDIKMDLMQNSGTMARAECYQRAEGMSFTCFTAITVHLQAGNTVWVRSYNYDKSFWRSSFDNFFSGVLVMADN